MSYLLIIHALFRVYLISFSCDAMTSVSAALIYSASSVSTGACRWTATLDRVLGTSSQSVVMRLDWGSSTSARQWLLNMGQANNGAHHWLYGTSVYQFGIWGSSQLGISSGSLSNCQTLVTTFSSSSRLYTLYCNGQFYTSSTFATTFSITSTVTYVGVTPFPGDIDFQGCVREISIYDTELTAAQVASVASNPTSTPTFSPTSVPSKIPTVAPTSIPTGLPTRVPTLSPTTVPTPSPSISLSPTGEPSCKPSRQPTGEPTGKPSGEPTGQPSSKPSGQPTGEPTGQPSGEPSGQPTGKPSGQPTGEPSRMPSGQPTGQPTGMPSEQPTGEPTGQPSGDPTRQPTDRPSGQPTGKPTGQPSGDPSGQPTGKPSGQPTGEPTGKPSGDPTGQPTGKPSGQPTGKPSGQPSGKPTSPTSEPSSQPTGKPSGEPTRNPSFQPTGNPSEKPSSQPSNVPTQPSAKPSYQPSNLPTAQPSLQPSGEPTSLPTCAVGKFDGDLSSCPPCAAGEYSPMTNMDYCLSCPQGTYQPNHGSTDCTVCPYPFTNLKAGSSDCSAISLNMQSSTKSMIFSFLTALILNILLVPSVDPITHERSWIYFIPMLANLISPTLDVFSDLYYLLSYTFFDPFVFCMGCVFVLYPVPSFVYLMYKDGALAPTGLMMHPRKCFVLRYGQNIENDYIYYPTLFNMRFLGLIAFKKHNSIYSMLWEVIIWILAIISQIILCCLYAVIVLLIGGSFSLAWLLFGSLLYMTKAIASTRVWNIWFRVWTGDDRCHSDIIGIDTLMFNRCILHEFMYETFFQIFLQIANNQLTGTWTPSAYFSCFFSFVMAVNAFYKFYYYQHLANRKEQMALEEIPVSFKLEIFGKVLFSISVPPQKKTRKHSRNNVSRDIELGMAVHKDSYDFIALFGKEHEKGEEQEQQRQQDNERRSNGISTPPVFSPEIVGKDMGLTNGSFEKVKLQEMTMIDESPTLLRNSNSTLHHLRHLLFPSGHNELSVINKSAVELMLHQSVESTPSEISHQNSKKTHKEDEASSKLIELESLKLFVPKTTGKGIVDIELFEVNVNGPAGYYVTAFHLDSTAKEVLKLGDKIETIDGQQVEGKSILEIQDIVCSCQSEIISFSIMRKCVPVPLKDSECNFNLVVESLPNQLVESKMLSDYLQGSRKEDNHPPDSTSTNSTMSTFSNHSVSNTIGKSSLNTEGVSESSDDIITCSSSNKTCDHNNDTVVAGVINRNLTGNTSIAEVLPNRIIDFELSSISHEKNALPKTNIVDRSEVKNQMSSRDLTSSVMEDHTDAKDVFPLYSLLFQQLRPAAKQHRNIHEPLLESILSKLSEFGIYDIESLLSYSPTEFTEKYIMKKMDLSRPNAQLVLKMFKHVLESYNEGGGLSHEDRPYQLNNSIATSLTLSSQDVPELSRVLTLKSGRTRQLSQEDAALLQFAKSAQQPASLLLLPPDEELTFESSEISADVMKSGRTCRLSQEDAALLQFAKSAQHPPSLLPPDKSVEIMLESSEIVLDVIKGSDTVDNKSNR